MATEESRVVLRRLGLYFLSTLKPFPENMTQTPTLTQELNLIKSKFRLLGQGHRDIPNIFVIAVISCDFFHLEKSFLAKAFLPIFITVIREQKEISDSTNRLMRVMNLCLFIAKHCIAFDKPSCFHQS